MSIEKQLARELPTFSSLEDRVFYQQEKQREHFVFDMAKNVSYEQIEKRWSEFTDEEKKQIKHDYAHAKNKINIMAQCIINQRNLCLLSFLLNNGFCFNVQDLDLLKKNNWMEYQPVGDNYNITVYMLDYSFKSIYENLKTWFKKTCRIKQRPAFYLVEYFQKETRDVLSQHLEKLPVKIKSKVIRELPQEELTSLLEQQKNNKLAFFR